MISVAKVVCDAWFRAAEVYDKRLKDHVRARGTYRRVPPTSPHFSDARKRLQKELS